MKKCYFKTIIVFCISLLLTITVSATGTISGKITYHEEVEMANVKVYLYDDLGTLVDSTFSDANGDYSFIQIPFGNYIVRVSPDQPACDVDLADTWMVAQHLLGFTILDQFELFAADVNGDESVSWSDYFIILINYLTQNNAFPTGEWKAEEQAVVLTTQTTSDDNDAKVTSTGDVNAGGGSPDKLTPAGFEIKSFEEIFINAFDDIIEVPVYVENNTSIYGYHIALEYNNDALEILEVTSYDDNCNYYTSDGILKITSMSDDGALNELKEHTAIATVKMRLKERGEITDLLSLVLSNDPQFVGSDGELINSLQISIPKIVNSSGSPTKDFEISNNYPNPFTTATNIDYFMPESGNITFAVYNTVGQIINKSNTEYKEAGTHKFQFEGSNLPKGMYICRIIYSDINQKEYIKTIAMIKSN